MPSDTLQRIEVDVKDLEDLIDRVKKAVDSKDSELLEKFVASYAYLTDLIEDKSTTITRLRKLLFGSKSEKSKTLLGEEEPATKPAEECPSVPGPEVAEGETAGSGADPKEAEEQKPKGHGRHGADAYEGAEKLDVTHETLAAGDPCPRTGCKGKVYRLAEPAVIVRVRGQAPLMARVWALERLRCNLCGEVFTAKAPDGVGEEKYDEAAKAMMALLRYGKGFPFNRLEKLEGNLGIPLAASTQWEIVEDLSGILSPAYHELIRQAAQGEVLHNDDTPMKILRLVEPGTGGGRDPPREEGAKRRGVFTSGIVSVLEGRRMAVFFTGPRHAGENLDRVLKERAKDLSAPIQMCDALSRNVTGGVESRLANCLAHGRRKFVEILEIFPQECRKVLESLRRVYLNEKRSGEQRLSSEERLRFHQSESGPIMEDLKAWLDEQIVGRKVEPNSRLGGAIEYLRNHWKELTLFLREPGAPLDNNICERALKKAILHRNNSLFYRSSNGARVGDLFMSLIHTCELVGVNALEYLVELQRHAEDLAACPNEWMPWNYRTPLERVGPV